MDSQLWDKGNMMCGDTFREYSEASSRLSIVHGERFRAHVTEYVAGVITYEEPLVVTTDAGNAVLLSESEYKGLLEAVYGASNHRK